MKELIPEMKAFWSEVKGKIHIDAWREVTKIDDFSIEIVPKKPTLKLVQDHLFFINLGGYKENEFEEYHYKMLTIAQNVSEASKLAKATAFCKHFGFKGATSHIDDKYGVDIDEIYNVVDILSHTCKENFSLNISKATPVLQEDFLHIGYLKLDKILF